MKNFRERQIQTYGEDFVDYLYKEVSIRKDKKYKIVEALLQGKSTEKVAELFNLSNSHIVATSSSVVLYFSRLYSCSDNDVYKLELSARVYHALYVAKILTIPELKSALEDGTLLKVRNIGSVGIGEIKKKLDLFYLK